MILDKIAAFTKIRVKRREQQCPLWEIRKKALELGAPNPFAFEKSLSGDDIAFICEVKKASPSKGVISEQFHYLDIARDYKRAGAAAISVLTEPEYFLG